MTERKLRVMFASFSYGGNGGLKSEHPDVRDWMLRTLPAAKADPRVEEVLHMDFADTPITMTRNKAVLVARDAKVDLLFMVDSDMSPDCELADDPEAKPFWDVAFNFLYNHYDRGPACIAAPYCGPPPHENVYVFRWRKRANHSKNVDWWLDGFEREEAAEKAGIEPVAALPTGLIGFDMRCFELIEPPEPTSPGNPGDTHAWFRYEWSDQYCSNKGSTEDVVTTRNISVAGLETLGYSPIYVAWNCWAGHWKPHMVRKPRLYPAECVSAEFRAALKRNPFGTRRINLPGFYSHVMGNGQSNGRPGARGAPITESNVEDNAGHLTVPEDLAYLQSLVRECAKKHPDRPLEIIEIGSFAGQSAVAMAEQLDQLPHKGRIRCVDTWEGSRGEPNGEMVDELISRGEDIYQIFQKNTGIYHDLITPHRGSSLEVGKKALLSWPKADLILIDAAHDYDSVCADIDLWIKLLASDGVMVGHDYATFEGVREAVWDRFHNWNTHENFWSFRRDKDLLLSEVNNEPASANH